MADPTGSHTRRQVERLQLQFAQRDGLPFANVLPADRIERALREKGATWREKVFTPVLTVWAFLTQVLDPVACCRAAVGRVMAWSGSQGLSPCGPGTGGYCKARGRLPEGLLARLAREPGVGFPQARVVAVFSLAAGALVDAAVGPSRGKQSGENALLRSIAAAVEAGSVLVADRYFAGWFDLALLQDRR